jgi:hypothetical protein
MELRVAGLKFVLASLWLVSVACQVVLYSASPTCTVSTSVNSTSMNFSAIGIKLIIVEFVIRKFVQVEFSLCTTLLVQISHSTIFSRSQKSY